MSRSQATILATVPRGGETSMRHPDVYANFRICLKQWRMLHAVIDCGSFANAAEFLHVSQPSISYSIARLEEQIGVSLLKLEGRKHQITDEGNALLNGSRLLLEEASKLEQFAKDLRQGCRKEVRLAVHQEFPTSLLIPAVRTFSTKFGDTKVHLMQLSMSELETVLHEQSADLAIIDEIPNGFQGNLLVELEYVPVARPNHPFFKLDRGVSQADLEREVWVVPKSEITAHIKGKTPGRKARQCWQVCSVDTAERVLCAGFGYGWLPRDRIQSSLDKGLLKILPLQDYTTFGARFYLIHGLLSANDSASSRIAEILHDCCGKR